MLEPVPTTREPRHCVLLSATVERFGRVRTTLHRIRNLSAAGACIATASDFRRGETIVISVGALRAESATVKWVENDSAGVMFVKPIDLAAARSKAAIKPQLANAKQVWRIAD